MGIKILLHPDRFYDFQSGSVASRTAVKILTEMGYEVGVYTNDNYVKQDFNFKPFQRLPYTSKANLFSKKYESNFVNVLNKFKPDYMFFIGGMIHTPVVYLKKAREMGIKTVFLFLVQDLYCARLHAAFGNSSCTKCLNQSNFNSIKNNCLEKGRSKYLYFLSYQINQKLFLKEFKKLHLVLGSTNEQLGFYKKLGISSERIKKIPLFF
ncbi:MAG: hypothetical protein CMC04_07750 [Flavobacteriaceae bacterium]|nr:hypothetical protein [Flavobacteriaceae bacterium]